MQYKVIFAERAKKQLKKLDKHIAALIIGWLEKNIQNCENPRLHGKGFRFGGYTECRKRFRRYGTK